jgi:hypothetical protein
MSRTFLFIFGMLNKQEERIAAKICAEALKNIGSMIYNE